jgi:hypothetical protein
MKEKIKIKFVDFWTDMNQAEGNYFYEILSRQFDVELSEEPDIIFYSNYGSQYLKYKCIRIFFSAENHRPDYTSCDYAITFDYIDHPRHLRFPLWALYYLAYINWLKVDRLDKEKLPGQLLENWISRKKFCCFIVSNPFSKRRNEFFSKLNSRKHVDSAGKYMNNIGYLLEGGSKEKLNFIKDYKFVISFENSAFPGYTTEKVLEPLLAGCIPIYWGNPLVQKDFNTRRMINWGDFGDDGKVIDHILKIEGDDQLAMQILQEKCFTEDQKNIEVLEGELIRFMEVIVKNRDHIRPRSKDVKLALIHTCKRINRIFMDKARSRLKLNYR